MYAESNTNAAVEKHGVLTPVVTAVEIFGEIIADGARKLNEKRGIFQVKQV